MLKEGGVSPVELDLVDKALEQMLAAYEKLSELEELQPPSNPTLIEPSSTHEDLKNGTASPSLATTSEISRPVSSFSVDVPELARQHSVRNLNELTEVLSLPSWSPESGLISTIPDATPEYCSTTLPDLFPGVNF